MIRFNRYFPVASFIIANIWRLLPVFGAFAVLAGAFSIHYGLSVMCVWLGLVCFWVDRKHLDYCLFTPLQPLAVVLIMGLGAGVSMVTIDAPEKYSYGFLAMQLVGLLGFPFLITGYALMMRQVPAFVFPRLGTPGTDRLTKPLVPVGWFLLTVELMKIVAGIVSGSSDRGYGGDFLVETPFGWWTAFSIFLRFQTLGYVLVPLIWRESRVPGKVLVCSLVGAILFLHFVAGSRGAVFFPLFILMVGSYLFLEIRRVKYELILLIGLIGLAPLVTLMANYRSSAAFRETDIRNIFQKLGTLKEGFARQAEQSEEHFAEAGRAFIGVADVMVYEMTPDVIPHEGFARLQDSVWSFIPYILYKGNGRPVIQDGYQIVRGYTGAADGGRTSVEISLPAELYRRWGWVGVPVGLFFYGLFYGAVFRFVYQLYLFRNALWGFMVCGLFFNFFISWFWGSALSMSWYWTYDIPKHLLALGCLYFAIKMFLNLTPPPGALVLIRASDSGRRRRRWLEASAPGFDDPAMPDVPSPESGLKTHPDA